MGQMIKFYRRFPKSILRGFTVVICLATSFVAAPMRSLSQGTTRARPKIGVALSGGGARGFAHIGVLQYFDEHRIPVDFIAGTSMGGLIGAMYAMGKSPAEIRQLVTTLDWDILLRGYTAFRDLAYRRKEDRLYIPGQITIGLRHGVQLPAGINPGHDVGLLFDRFTLPYDNIASFDDLPIPFRCVATDLVAAEPVVFKDGSLSRALRATMSIPGVFSPVEVNGRLLSDGAALNNIPTDVVKDGGADVVIGVDIGTPLGDKESVNNLFSVLNQTNAVSTMESVRRNLRLADLLISPDLEKYNVLDFKRGAEIADLGYKGAEQKALLLQNFSVSEQEWQAYLAKKRSRILTDVPVPTFVRVEGMPPSVQRTVTSELKPFAGQPIDTALLEKRLTRIRGTGRFESMDYGWIVDNGKPGLIVRGYEKTYGPPFLDLGVQIDNSNTDDTNVNLRGRLTFYDFGREGAEWRTDFSLGTTLNLATEYFRPIGDTRFFVAGEASIGTLKRNLFLNGKKQAEYKQNTQLIGADIGYSINSKSELRTGFNVGHQSANLQVGLPLLGEPSGTLSAFSIRYNYYGQNSPQFPTRGLVIRSSFNYFFKSPESDEQYPQGEVIGSYSYIYRDNNVLMVRGGGGTTFDHHAGPLQQFTLGGLFRLGGFGRDELRGDNYLFGETGYMRRLYRLPPFLGGSLFAGGWFDAGSAYNSWDDAQLKISGTGGLLMETRLGPLFIGGAWGEGGRKKFYFALGRIF
jgi:NTE family protein